MVSAGFRDPDTLVCRVRLTDENMGFVLVFFCSSANRCNLGYRALEDFWILIIGFPRAERVTALSARSF
jgi:hypothetical protein